MKRTLVLILIFAASCLTAHSADYVFSENAGWMQTQPASAPGLLQAGRLNGYLYAENIGWVRLGSTTPNAYVNSNDGDWGVNVDAGGNLSGYAWSETAGWLTFGNAGVTAVVDLNTGALSGYVWSENLGWIKLDEQISYYPYFWAENAGWINVNAADVPGIVDYGAWLGGMIYAENIGWIKLGHALGGPYFNTNSQDWGVNIDASGSLSGYAWSETSGWLSFDPANGDPHFDATLGVFVGHVWSENLGWINFGHASKGYKGRLTLDVAAADADGDLVPDALDAFPDDPAASVDTDDDGYPDEWNPGKSEADSTTGLTLDAFPDDVAASTDTDIDGQPDNWNEGYTAQDSTSNLTIDNDDDDDGTLDSVDPFPQGNPPEGLSPAPVDYGLFGIERQDGQSDLNNLDDVTGNPVADLVFNFQVSLRDTSGVPPAAVKLVLNGYAYDMKMTAGDLINGAVYTYSALLAPTVTGLFHFETCDIADNVIEVLDNVGTDFSTPAIELLNGANMVGVPGNLAVVSFDAITSFGTTNAYRWVSTGRSGSSNQGYYELVDTMGPVEAGEGFYVQRGAQQSLPDLSAMGVVEIMATTTAIALQPGWNLISNPYDGYVLLDDVQVQKDVAATVSWDEAVTSSWLINAIYTYDGSDWGGTYRFYSAGGVDVALLVPHIGYWVYLNRSDGNYSLIVPKPQ